MSFFFPLRQKCCPQNKIERYNYMSTYRTWDLCVCVRVSVNASVDNVQMSIEMSSRFQSPADHVLN